ncbi:hypothetical protein CLU79DRAFT_744333 [Phycomyces nitens]|nr:hypothetical protein CLU79DRAFT_744333 [Phycomyces nitens]
MVTRKDSLYGSISCPMSALYILMSLRIFVCILHSASGGNPQKNTHLQSGIHCCRRGSKNQLHLWAWLKRQCISMVLSRYM